MSLPGANGSGASVAHSGCCCAWASVRGNCGSTSAFVDIWVGRGEMMFRAGWKKFMPHLEARRLVVDGRRRLIGSDGAKVVRPGRLCPDDDDGALARGPKDDVDSCVGSCNLPGTLGDLPRVISYMCAGGLS